MLGLNFNHHCSPLSIMALTVYQFMFLNTVLSLCAECTWYRMKMTILEGMAQDSFSVLFFCLKTKDESFFKLQRSEQQDDVSQLVY